MIKMDFSRNRSFKTIFVKKLDIQNSKREKSHSSYVTRVPEGNTSVIRPFKFKFEFEFEFEFGFGFGFGFDFIKVVHKTM